MNEGALFLMCAVGMVGAIFFAMFALPSWYEKRQFWAVLVGWLLFWCGPPLFRLWIVGVMS